MNYYYDPEVAAPARRLGQLHLPGDGRQGGDGEDRPRACVDNPLIFPDDATPAPRPTCSWRSPTSRDTDSTDRHFQTDVIGG